MFSFSNWDLLSILARQMKEQLQPIIFKGLLVNNNDNTTQPATQRVNSPALRENIVIPRENVSEVTTQFVI